MNKLNDVHQLRGIAILLIVAAHARFRVDWTNDLIAHKLVELASRNSTTIFFFISGYLFFYIYSKEKFLYFEYLKKKWIRVILPFIIFSLPFSLYYYSSSFEIFLKSFIYGSSDSYWFVPVVTVFFLLAPILIIMFKKLTVYQLVFSIILFMLISFLLQRPVGNKGILQAFLYFLPAYMVGMFWSKYREKIESNIMIIFPTLITVLLILSTYIFIYANQKTLSPEFLLMQKLLLGISVLHVLSFLKINNKVLSFLAINSYGLYFIHDYFRSFFGVFFSGYLNYSLPVGLVGYFLFYLYLCSSVFIAAKVSFLFDLKMEKIKTLMNYCSFKKKYSK